jgi:hypothetical protein
MKTLPKKIETIQDVKDFAEYIKVVDDAAISPDDSFSEYVCYKTMEPTYTKEQAQERDKLMEQCFAVCEREGVDIYELLNCD